MMQLFALTFLLSPLILAQNEKHANPLLLLLPPDVFSGKRAEKAEKGERVTKAGAQKLV